ncbi:hypothetical protein DL89DRAFT_265904 [Linderina pennispora]|uniref:Phosphatidylinositol N-acetylglucosaminyltransferase subunit H conserved domain-containing protein n=1 Tax=Linderina pennispora TaxID=61395 RepID=A0A1Y1WFL7_9FUNG|nr:uncharacterized protein DL89DRAFT_265904 [Linderina pennispora]ORX72313.1 hypothetical protein DL89DRAFT_265904 [Linderina pennispora]
MKRLRRVISKQNTTPASPVLANDVPTGPASWSAEATEDRSNSATLPITSSGSGDSKEGSFLGIDLWPRLGRSSQRRRENSESPSLAALPMEASPQQLPSMHRASHSFSSPYSPITAAKDLRLLREGSLHKRTSSSVLPSKLPQRFPFGTSIFSTAKQIPQSPTLRSRFMHQRQPTADSIPEPPDQPDVPKQEFIGYPPGGLEVRGNALVLVCEQRSPDICEYTVRQDSAGIRASDIMAIALMSWAGHIFFRGPILLAFLPMVLYLVRSGLQVYKETLVVIRDVGIQTETVTLAGFRSVRSYERHQIGDIVIHEALHMFEYRYYMAIMPRDPEHRIVIMFPHLLPKLDGILHVYHGARQLLFS